MTSSDLKPFAGSLLPMSTNGTEFSYSFWLLINDWNFNYGKPKCILFRSTGDVKTFSVASPSIWLYPYENKMMVRLSTMLGKGGPNTPYDNVTYNTCNTSGNKTYSNANPKYFCDQSQFNTINACDIDGIPLQKWVHVSVILWNRTLDVYMNGKLARSCVLPGMPVTDSSQLNQLNVGYCGGNASTFNGYISRLRYWNRAITAAEVYNTYTDGPLPLSYWWSQLVNKVNVTLNVN